MVFPLSQLTIRILAEVVRDAYHLCQEAAEPCGNFKGKGRIVARLYGDAVGNGCGLQNKKSPSHMEGDLVSIDA
jgi:hypothetical protein